jgi:ABC-type uncharacterized transport system substrate-binding protein
MIYSARAYGADRGTGGKNFVIEYRYLEGELDRAPGLVAELVQSNVDVLVIQVLPGVRAAKQATKTIPIVMVASVDPVVTGIVDSLARPAGNITGLTTLGRDLSGKRLELFKEAVPRISRIGVLWTADAPAITGGSNDATAAKNATQTIPIVFSGAVSDPVGAGLVSSLARPGGNITGFTTIATDLSGKRLELLKDAVPKLGRVAVLWDPRKRRRRVAVERTSVGGQSAGRAAPFDGGVEPRSI